MLACERAAHACGGCFHPVENPTVVTDHRMVLSISQDQSTLYDQIEYTGSPSSFAWVLPVMGTVDVGVGADTVFSILDARTATRITPPPSQCPPPPPCATLDAGSNVGAPGVDVVRRQVVGPYESVQIHPQDPTDAKAVGDWLANSGFVLPPDVAPIVQAYVSEGFDFLALKLLPNATVKSMRPVRVTTHGASATLPLRMVAAGSGAKLGITLWVIAEGRYQPQSFPFFHIETSDVVWDWSATKSNYTELRAAHVDEWEIECSVNIGLQEINPADSDYDPFVPDGGAAETAAQAHRDDIATLFHGISATARVTRVRADLSRASLAKDLTLVASPEQIELSNLRQLAREVNTPPCPTYAVCSGDGDGESFTCAAGSRSSPYAWLVASFMAVAAAARRRR
jgi:hypothetical protein